MVTILFCRQPGKFLTQINEKRWIFGTAKNKSSTEYWKNQTNTKLKIDKMWKIKS